MKSLEDATYILNNICSYLAYCLDLLSAIDCRAYSFRTALLA